MEDSGGLTLTMRNLYFVGHHHALKIPVRKILSAHPPRRQHRNSAKWRKRQAGNIHDRRSSIRRQLALPLTQRVSCFRISISRKSPAGDRRPSSSRRTRRGGLRRILPSCRSCCGWVSARQATAGRARCRQHRHDLHSPFLGFSRLKAACKPACRAECNSTNNPHKRDRG
jgi:hypothetical protein